MGYALTKILIYGIEVSEAVAERIYNDPDCYDEEIGPTTLRAAYEAGLLKPIKSLPWMDTANKDRYEVQLLSDGSDSRIDSLGFDPGYPHFFGVVLASNGYAYSDNLSGTFHHPATTKHPEAIDRWNKYVLPILLKYMSEVPEPAIHTIGQTW